MWSWKAEFDVMMGRVDDGFEEKRAVGIVRRLVG